MATNLEKYLKGLELPPATLNFETDLNNWTRFEHQVRAAVKGSGRSDCFTLTIPADDDNDAPLQLDTLGQAHQQGGQDRSSQHALMIVEMTSAEKLRMQTALAGLTQARKNKRD
jgi:hypothetical protein